MYVLVKLAMFHEPAVNYCNLGLKLSPAHVFSRYYVLNQTGCKGSKTRKPKGFEDVGNIETSTFESFDCSAQFGVTALVLWLLGSRKEAWTTLAFDTSRHHHPLRPCSLRVLSWLFAWATLPPCLCKAAAVMRTLYQLRPRMATPRL